MGGVARWRVRQEAGAVCAGPSRRQSCWFPGDRRGSCAGVDQYGARAVAPGSSHFYAPQYNGMLLHLFFPFILCVGSCWKTVMFAVTA